MADLPDFNTTYVLGDPRNRMVFDLAALIHEDQWLAAGSFYAAYVRKTKDPSYPNPATKEDVVVLVTQLVHWCLNNDRYSLAARLLWTNSLFDARPHFTQLIWETLKKSASVMLMGSASASKSYSTGVWLLLDWVRDPENTCVKLLGPSEKHLNENLFTHIINLHQNASIPLPGETGDLWIGMDRKNKFGSISGTIVPLGKKSAGRLQGTKKGNRKKPHPIFGVSRRLRVFMDESEKIPQGIWKDVDNIFSNLEGIEHFKIICAYNPENQNGESGTRCEPVGGWTIFDIDRDEIWRSRRGWDVVRLDGFKGENVVHKKTIFQGLQTWESIQKLIENAGGYDSPGYYCVDEKTEVLSRRGWLKHDQVLKGDLVYTVNTETGLAEWELIEEVFSKRFKGKLVSMEGRGFSALVTANHRWAVTKKNRQRLEFKETKALQSHDNIPLSRPAAYFGYEDDADFSAIVGWVVTDGTYEKAGRRVTIYQSHASNPDKCAVIRELLARNTVFSEDPRADGMTVFRFSGDVAEKVRKVTAHKKILTLDFVCSLTERALNSLWIALVMGDGGFSGGSNDYVCSSVEEQAGVYAVVAAKLGWATTTHFRKDCGKGNVFPTGLVSKGCDMWYVQARRSVHTRPENMEIRGVEYDGTVWCPRTRNGTFFARRDGGTYFTGNTMARAAFPPSDVKVTVIPQGMAEAAKGTFIFLSAPTPCGACDPALEGGDSAPFSVGEYGLAVGYKTMPSVKFPMGETIYFKDIAGQRIARPALQVVQLFKLTQGNAVSMATQIRDLCRKLSIKPEWFAMDTTGAGQGIYDILADSWSPLITGINYSESASETRILEEDSKTAKEEYDRACSELWFALRKWMEFKLLLMSPMIDFQNLLAQLTGRQYHPKKLSAVESKPTYKARNAGKSPDEADTLTLLVAAARRATGVIPSMKIDRGADGTGGSAEHESEGGGFSRTDLTNRMPEDLD